MIACANVANLVLVRVRVGGKSLLCGLRWGELETHCLRAAGKLVLGLLGNCRDLNRLWRAGVLVAVAHAAAARA